MLFTWQHILGFEILVFISVLMLLGLASSDSDFEFKRLMIAVMAGIGLLNGLAIWALSIKYAVTLLQT